MEFSPYQTDVLFLLVGTNPLPNYVAALLLTTPHGKVYLLHTDTTLEIAKRLEHHLIKLRRDLIFVSREISRFDPQVIARQMARIIAQDRIQDSRVGLNYTGGTKPMAVHVYHALRVAFPQGVFSYLDAETLSIVIEQQGTPTQQVFACQSVAVDFATLFDLHGYSLKGPRPMTFPPALRQALVGVHSTREGFQQWRNWLQSFEEGDPALPTTAQYPALAPVIEQFAALCDDQAPTPERVAAALGCKNSRLVSCAKMLIADWLEEYVCDALAGLASQLGLHQVGMGLEPERTGQRNAELDVAAILGYQLFAISCIATDRPQPAKDHLMETFVRARQLGGDEARFALVCCVEYPDALKREVSQSWDAEGKIRVFGQQHLPSLTQHLELWIKTAGRL